MVRVQVCVRSVFLDMELGPLVMLVLVTTLAHLDEVDGKSKPAGRGRGSMWWYVYKNVSLFSKVKG